MNPPNSPDAKWFALVNDRNIPAPRRHVGENVLRTQGEIPDDHVLIRDHNSPEDIVLAAGAAVDLAAGNVFYSRPRCEVTPRSACIAEAKLAFLIDDRSEITVVAIQTRESLLALFNLDPNIQLFRDFESPNDEGIGAGAKLAFQDGPVFYTRGRPEALVEIKIGEKFFKVRVGEYTATDLKRIGGVPLTDELEQVIDQKLHPLQDDQKVCIRGGEVFIGHPRSGTSS